MVYDGVAAIEVAEVFRPDVMILDIDMPELDGFEVARRIAGQSWGKGILLVALTGWAQVAADDRWKDAVFHHHLVKPVAVEEVEALLARPEAGT